jgi:hypothetical protein
MGEKRKWDLVSANRNAEQKLKKTVIRGLRR